MWITPARVVIGLSLLWPLDESMPMLNPFCCGPDISGASVCQTCGLFHVVGAIADMMMVVGLLTRPACLIALPVLVIRGISDLYLPVATIPAGISETTGLNAPWTNGLAYLAGVLLVIDVMKSGGGRWSLDRLMSGWAESRARRTGWR
jgi:hypothetical protein